jgi:hypothetical protein
VALLIVGVLAFGQADDARETTADLRRTRAVLETQTAAAEQAADAPIGGAERVANSVATIVEVSGTVILESATTNRLLGEAVGLANRGNRAAGNRIYEGEAAASVRRLNEDLARARASLAAAQQAANELNAGAP